MTLLEVAPLVGGALYVSNLALGAGLQLRLWHLHRAKWVHHALYFLVCVGTALAAYALYSSGRRWWALIPTGACLALLPRARGGSGRHMALTLVGVLAYVVALV